MVAFGPGHWRPRRAVPLGAAAGEYGRTVVVRRRTGCPRAAAARIIKVTHSNYLAQALLVRAVVFFPPTHTFARCPEHGGRSGLTASMIVFRISVIHILIRFYI